MIMMSDLNANSITHLLDEVKKGLGFPVTTNIVFDFEKFRLSQAMYCKLTKEYIEQGIRTTICEDFLCQVQTFSDTSDDVLALELGFIKSISSFDVTQNPISDSENWHAITKWTTEDVLQAAKEQGISLSEEQVESWWRNNENHFQNLMVEAGNNILAEMNFEI